MGGHVIICKVGVLNLEHVDKKDAFTWFKPKLLRKPEETMLEPTYVAQLLIWVSCHWNSKLIAHFLLYWSEFNLFVLSFDLQTINMMLEHVEIHSSCQISWENCIIISNHFFHTPHIPLSKKSHFNHLPNNPNPTKFHIQIHPKKLARTERISS